MPQRDNCGQVHAAYDGLCWPEVIRGLIAVVGLPSILY